MHCMYKRRNKPPPKKVTTVTEQRMVLEEESQRGVPIGSRAPRVLSNGWISTGLPHGVP